MRPEKPERNTSHERSLLPVFDVVVALAGLDRFKPAGDCEVVSEPEKVLDHGQHVQEGELVAGRQSRARRRKERIKVLGGQRESSGPQLKASPVSKFVERKSALDDHSHNVLQKIKCAFTADQLTSRAHG